jgi:transcriptional regulator NrdR family protein
MKCPLCGAWTEVLETRTRKDKTKRRTYQCANMHKFRTVEVYEPEKGVPGTGLNGHTERVR